MLTGKDKGIFFALLAAVVSGISVYLNKFAVGQTDPVLFSLLKNGIVAVALGAFFVKLPELRKSVSSRNLSALAYVSLASGGLAFLLFFLGLKETSAVSANIFHKSMFLAVLPLSFILLKKVPSRSQLLVSALLAAGNILFWRVANLSLNSGDLFILAATALWAGEAVLSEKLFSSGISAKTLAFFRFAGGLPVLLGFLLLRGTDWSLASRSLGWTFALSGILLAYALSYFAAVRHSGAFRATAALSIAPVLTFALSSGLSFSSAAQAIGAAILVFGIVLALRPTGSGTEANA